MSGNLFGAGLNLVESVHASNSGTQCSRMAR